eukprot:CAMPEP_0177658752 /NCGR_PEP_ID=MMETSP0447-20121125/17023_1 /TAXON_ID=0 /ORGANISM="Stygamoeba regulata, Strain BSH-02190019" /LENGTH=536 /DNA_ID=CAMNT_0019163469 /DNA_START=75 /DNA_END=1682 /DNA_ORIENTATION=-
MADLALDALDERLALPYVYVNEKTIDHALTCALICMEPLHGPVVAACCGIFLCEDCAAQCGHCPQCRRAPFIYDECVGSCERLMQMKLASLQVYCANKDSGCKWEGERGNHKDHLGNCAFFDCRRRSEGCPWLGRCDDIRAHESADGCMFRKCRNAFRGCTQLGSRSQLELHLQWCGFQLVHCQYDDCTWTGLRNKSEAHELLCAQTSDYAQVECSIAPGACEWKGTRKDFNSVHSRKCAHLPMERRLAILEEDLVARMEERLDLQRQEMIKRVDDAVVQTWWLAKQMFGKDPSPFVNPLPVPPSTLHYRGFDFSRFPLGSLSLVKLDLRGAVFPKSLNGIDFSHAQLDNVDFSGVEFQSCTFTAVSATDTNFSRATLTGCNFSHAVLTRVSFQDAILRIDSYPQTDILFRDATLRTVTFRSAQFGRYTSSSRMDRDCCRWDRAILENVDFSGATLDQERFDTAASFKTVLMTEARLNNVQFLRDQLPNVTLGDSVHIKDALANVRRLRGGGDFPSKIVTVSSVNYDPQIRTDPLW